MLSGLAFSDGNCSKPFHPTLGRASWAAGSVDTTGKLIGVSVGPVWKQLAQTSPPAELVALAAVAQLVPLEAQKEAMAIEMGIDNIMAVGVTNQPPRPSSLHKAFHAGLVRNLWMQHGWPNIRSHACHVRSHQIDDMPAERMASLAPRGRQLALGNKMFDDYATLTKKTHP